MRHPVLIVCLSILLAACSISVGTPAVLKQTPPVILMDSPTPTPIASIYDQGIDLFDYDEDLPVQITERSVQQENGYVLHDIEYPSPKIGTVPAYLLVPDGAGPFA